MMDDLFPTQLLSHDMIQYNDKTNDGCFLHFVQQLNIYSLNFTGKQPWLYTGNICPGWTNWANLHRACYLLSC